MEARRCRRSGGSAAAGTTRRRLCRLLALAGDYLKYLFMKRGRLLGRVARRALAQLVLQSSSSGGGGGHVGKRRGLAQAAQPWPPSCAPALAEREFSCSNSPSPAFLAARRLRSRLRRGACSSCFGALRPSCGSAATSTEAAAADEEDEEEEEEVDDGGWARGMELDVDYRAEEFINMFYEQLRAQSFQAALCHCRSP
ncbi:uncharacterized protein LOC102700309 [Oryza brachyantha]|uniref:uncharacterized protein LOC102700309 n=1 Tax=Oryza brachyantha TaxID=4533 RepID=UPI001ADAF81A|nr:uncharacterized protein LOC102700309 [Oryza brachyantha]